MRAVTLLASMCDLLVFVYTLQPSPQHQPYILLSLVFCPLAVVVAAVVKLSQKTKLSGTC